MMQFVDVVLPLAVAKPYTYLLSPEQGERVAVGMRVAVPFGSNKIYSALAYKLHNKPPTHYKAREVQEVLDTRPIVTSQQIQHWEWVAQYYLCTLGEVFRSVMPGILLLESETTIHLVSNKNNDISAWEDDEYLILEVLEQQTSLKIKEIQTILGKQKVLPVLQRLLTAGIIKLSEEVKEEYKPKLDRFVELDERYLSEAALHELLDLLVRAPKQKEVILTYYTIKATSKKAISYLELQKKSDASAGTLSALEEKGILKSYYQPVSRLPHAVVGKGLRSLATEQQQALSNIKEQFLTKDVVLLQGITSSGKTEIYSQLIDETLAEGRQVLYLLPEIALTTQLGKRLEDRFGNKVYSYHSRLTSSQRVEIWNKVLVGSSDAQIILGARSALFLPFINLGLIVIDEEHEPSYKQYDPAPRYHARDTALMLARFHKAKTLLGSATPSTESRYLAEQGKYGHVLLTKRFGDMPMPEIELVHLTEKIKQRKMKGHFADTLYNAMKEALNRKEQVILFQNRRGYAPVVECITCGFCPQCPNCDVSLTYHRFRNELRCHYCGYHTAMEEKCWACGGTDLDTKGFGTQQIEQELQELFPEVKVGRMDLDTTRGKQGFAKIIDAFESGDVEILVGTQMLTKGLDFRNVSLVGILHADALLNFPDFRSAERTFQLLYQVSGRAGRHGSRGKVIIQTYRPQHPVIQKVIHYDYEALFQDQIQERSFFGYPPFRRLLRITIAHKDLHSVNEAALWMVNYFKSYTELKILGPEFPPVARIRNRYHKNILIKLPIDSSLAVAKTKIEKGVKSFKAIGNYKKLKLILDVDCY